MLIGVLKVRFHQKNRQKIGFFVFKTLLLVLNGGCRQIFLHAMKLHAILVHLCIIVYRRQRAFKGLKTHLKQSYSAAARPSSTFRTRKCRHFLLGCVIRITLKFPSIRVKRGTCLNEVMKLSQTKPKVNWYLIRKYSSKKGSFDFEKHAKLFWCTFYCKYTYVRNILF